MKKTILLLAAFAFAAQADWKQWRGPTGQGHADAKLPTEWSETKNVKWRTPIPGKGWSSPVIEGDQIWMTTAFETAATEAEAKERLKKNTGGVPVKVLSNVQLHVVCVDKRTGKLLHNFEVITKKQPQWVHKLNSYASPSPIIEAGRVYCHFGSYGTVCIDAKTAKVAWRNEKLWVNHENGPGSTPVLWKDLLIFHMDGSDKQYVVALDKKTGLEKWRTARTGKMNENPQLKKSYGTPLIIKANGRDTLFSPASDWLYGYDPATGRELWKVAYGMLGFSVVPRPVTGHGMLFMSTSFMRSQLLAVRYENTGKPDIVWKYNRGVSKQPSPILIGDELYFVDDSGGLVTCLNAHTGDVHWRERLGGNYSASPLHANGKIYFHSREGITTVLQAGKTFKVLAKNKLDGQHMASAAVDGNALILRTDKALYWIESR
ncbi:MAG: PQQ-binding-like beta-propeller repeat protein [Verrucomicrobia subdivision 3 bacterium]|nr:PQQ-binding-like beta-propeller repeat protein [Limisphaerales bacterium]